MAIISDPNLIYEQLITQSGVGSFHLMHLTSGSSHWRDEWGNWAIEMKTW